MDEKVERDALEMMRVQAKMLREFYDALVEQKFRPNEAMALVQTWLDSSVRRPPEPRA